MRNKDPELFVVDGFYICSLCLDGAGGECHTPGCVLWLCRGPDIPIRQKLIDFGARIRTAVKHADYILDRLRGEE